MRFDDATTSINCSEKNFSITLFAIDRSDIGLKLLMGDTEPLLCTGKRRDVFNSSGWTDEAMIVDMMPWIAMAKLA